MKLPVVQSPPLTKPPPLIRLPAVPQAAVVAAAVSFAEVGPETLVCLTVTVMPLMLILLLLQSA